ncbi:MAG: hypothetical protein D6732_18010 [Methanobacteriota archaeon]|nr:MAG: hypothetical protein D6732_18010 [Euryarchaeota archaeon]
MVLNPATQSSHLVFAISYNKIFIQKPRLQTTKYLSYDYNCQVQKYETFFSKGLDIHDQQESIQGNCCRKNIEGNTVKLIVDDNPEPVMLYRKMFEQMIESIPKKDLSPQTQNVFNLIQNLRSNIRVIRVLFEKI